VSLLVVLIWKLLPFFTRYTEGNNVLQKLTRYHSPSPRFLGILFLYLSETSCACFLCQGLSQRCLVIKGRV
jgi:hypothetical protein